MVTGVTAHIHIKRSIAVNFRTETRLSQLNVARIILPLAISAQHANQPLGQHAIERRDKVVRLDAHVQETSDHVDDVVGVNRGEHEVPCKRGLNRDLRGLRVANLADHDLVRVVTQNGTKTTIERQSFLFVHGNLRDAVQLILNRILDGDDLVFFVSDLIQRGVERGRLARAGWTSHQDHAVRLRDVATKLAQILFRKTNDIQVEISKLFVDLFFVQDTNHCVFAVNSRHDRNAEVDVAAFITNSETAVLRHPTLGDVELRHDFDTRDQRLVISEIDRIDFRVQRTV